MSDLYERGCRMLTRINLLLAILGACTLCFVALIIFYEVISRNFLGASRLWVIEISEYALVYLTFLGAPYMLEKNKHVAMDLLINSLPRLSRQILTLLNNAMGILLCFWLAYAGFHVVQDQIETGVREVSVMAPPKYLISMIFPVVILLMALQFVDKFIRAIAPARRV